MKYNINGKPNRFAERTLAAFSETLMSLLESKPFENITVNELCETCNYPRSTFYNYFDDINDLLNYCWLCITREIKIDDYTQMKSDELFYTLFDRLYNYLFRHRERLQNAMKVNPINGALVLSCKLYAQQQANIIMQSNTYHELCPIPYKLVVEHYCATLQLVIEWCFLRDEFMTKEEAEKCLRYLLNNV